MLAKVQRKIWFSFICLLGVYIVKAQTSVTRIDSTYLVDGLSKAAMSYHFFDDTATVMYVYSSLFLDTLQENYTLEYAFTKTMKTGIKTLDIYNKKIQLKPTSSKHIIIESIPINDTFVQSGNYLVKISLYGETKKLLDKKSIELQVFKHKKAFYKGDPLPVLDYTNVENIENTFVAKYPKEQLIKNIKSLSPIASLVEEKVVQAVSKKDSLIFLQQFFYNFWKNRNEQHPDAEWQGYVHKLNAVGEMYSGSALSGYETDRGKIVLKYGEPSKVEKCLSEKGALPYEIWYYEAIGKRNNIYIIFYQAGIMAKDMQILIATDHDIFFDPYWKVKLFSDGSTYEQSNNHKAFEYFR